MYRIIKNGEVLSLEENLKYTKHQRNGCDVLCGRDEADGLVIGDSYVEPLKGLVIVKFDAAEQLAMMETALNELGVQTQEVTT